MASSPNNEEEDDDDHGYGDDNGCGGGNLEKKRTFQKGRWEDKKKIKMKETSQK